jgi:hypothetical protein
MSLENIFVCVFVIGFLGFILYSVITIIISEFENHKMDKKMMDSMSKKEREFKKRVWRY